MVVARQSRRSAWLGFALAPILYIIALAGIAGAVLFTGYTQILRSNVEITADNSVRNQIRMATEIIAAQSAINNALNLLVPPNVVTWASLDAARLPKNSAGTATVAENAVKGAAANVGGLASQGGLRQLDPWGRYYIMCRWEGSTGGGQTDPSISIISAGADGNLATTCSDTQAASGSDDKMEYMTVANVLSRSANWQAQNMSGGRTGYTFGIDPNSSLLAVGVDAASVDTSKSLDIGGAGRFRGNLNVNQALTVDGATALGNTLSVSGATTLSSTLGVTGATTMTTLQATATQVTTLAATGATTLSSTLGVTGATTLGGATQINNTLGVSGVTTLGTANITAGNIGTATITTANVTTGNIGTGNITTGNIGALTVTGSTTLNTMTALSGSVSGNLTVGGIIYGNLTGNVTGNVSGTAGGVDGANITGVVPIVSGGTGATSATNARANLGLAIGVNVQAWDTDLDALAANTATGFIRRTGAGAISTMAIQQSEVPAFTGATGGSAGTLGGVPIAAAGQQNHVLTGNGVWTNPAALVGIYQLQNADSAVTVDEAAGVGTIRFVIDGFEQARITGTTSADRSIRLTGGTTAVVPEVGTYASAGNSSIRVSAQGTGLLFLRTNGVDRFTIDASGNASMAGSMTATGGFIGNLTGVASSAAQLTTARNFSITGDATASSVSFNGTADVALNATITKLQGRSVVSTAPTSNQVLQWNGTAWAPTTLALSGSGIDGGTIGSSSGTALVLPDGSASTPSLRFLNSPSTGLYRSAADEISAAIAGTQRFIINNNGVRVGSTGVWGDYNAGFSDAVVDNVQPPSSANLLLDRTIAGSPTALQPTLLGAIEFRQNGLTGAGIYATNPNPQGSPYYRDIRFWTTRWEASQSKYATGDRMVITTDGRVGVGTDKPNASLHVIGAGVPVALQIGPVLTSGTVDDGAGAQFTPQVYNLQTSAVAGLGVGVFDGTNNRRAALFVDQPNALWGLTSRYTTASPAFVIRNNGAERLRITDTGNVGIGTPSPSQLLHVNGNAQIPTIFGGSGASQTFTLRNTSGNNNYIGITIGSVYNSDNGGISFFTAGPSTSIEAMRIQGTTGNVGIGTTAPTVPLQVSGRTIIGTPPTQAITPRLFVSGDGVFNALGMLRTDGWIMASLSPIGNNGLRVGGGNLNYVAIEGHPGDSTNEIARFNGSNGFVGIGTTSPTQRLHVAGLVRLSSDTSTVCDSNAAGAIRYNAGAFQQCSGSSWAALGSAGTGSTTTIGTLLVDNGSAASPSISFTNSPTTGMYRYASDSIGFATSGSHRLSISSPGASVTDINANNDDLTIKAGRRLYLQPNGGPWSAAYWFEPANAQTHWNGSVHSEFRGSYAPTTSGVGEYVGIKGIFTVNQTGGNAINYNGFMLQMIETSAPGTDNRLINLLANSSSRFTVTNTGQVGINTQSRPTLDLAFGGNVARTIGLERHTTANTAGNTLTVQAGGATSAASDKNGGDLMLSAGTSTGTGSSNISFRTATAQSSTNTTDNAPTTKMIILGSGNVGVGTSTPNANLHVIGSGTPTTPSEIIVSGPTSGTGGDAQLTLGQIPGGKDLRLLMAGTDTRSDGLIANDAYILSVQRINLETLGNAATRNVGITLGDSSVSPYGGITFKTAPVGNSAVTRMSVSPDGSVGIGTTSPTQKLDVVGVVRMRSDTTTTCDANAAGAIRNNANAFQFCGGSSWSSMVVGGAGTGTTLGTVLADNGTAAVPSFSFSGDTDNGMYLSGVNQLSFSTAGTQRVVVDASGKVGIGAANPTEALQVNGNIAIPVIDSGGLRVGSIARFGVDNSTETTISYSGALGFRLHDVTNARVPLKVSLGAPSNSLIITTSGDVGIGTASPRAKLDMSSGNMLMASEGNFIGFNLYWNGSAWAYRDAGLAGAAIRIGNVTNSQRGDIQFRTAGVNAGAADATAVVSQRMTITNGGNVGIGSVYASTAPSYLVSLDGTASRTIGMDRNTAGGSPGQWLTLLAGGTLSGNTDQNGGDLVLSGGTSTGTGSSKITFQTATPQSSSSTSDNAPTTKMTILGNGDVGIGTSPRFKLEVDGRIINKAAYNNNANLGSYDVGVDTVGANTSIYSYNRICTANALGTCNGTGGVVMGGAALSGVGTNITSGNSYFNGGNLAIGQENPGAFRLNVNGNTNITGNLTVSGTVSGSFSYTPPNNAWINSAEGAARIYYATNSVTYLRGTGLEFRNGSDTPLMSWGNSGGMTTNYAITTASTVTANGNAIYIQGVTPRVELIDSDAGSRRYVYSDAPNIGFLNSGGNWSAYVNDSNQFFAYILYDLNNTGFYVDPASTSILNDIRPSIIYDRDNTGYYADLNATTRLANVYPDMLYDPNDSNYRIDMNGTSQLNQTYVADLRPQVIYDWNNAAYYIDMDNGSNMNSVTANDFYANNWFRVNGGGGIYWQAYGGGWFMQDSTYVRTYNGKYVLAAGYYHTSDARMKHDIRPFRTSGLSVIQKLRAVHFIWNATGKEDFGVIAQEVKKVLPEAVNTDDNGFMQVQYDKLVLPVIEAIKELHAIVQGLAERLEVLLAWQSRAQTEIEAIKAANIELTKINASLREQLLKGEQHQQLLEQRLNILERHLLDHSVANDNNPYLEKSETAKIQRP